MSTVQGTLMQLDFDVVDPDDQDDPLEAPVAEPKLSTFKISGELSTRQQQRYMRSRLEVRLVDIKTGEIVAAQRARITNISFPLHQATETEAEWTERAHKVKLVGHPIEVRPGTKSLDPVQ